MKGTHSYVTGFFIITIALSSSIFADTKAFLCIPEIPGGSTDERSLDCIDITSLSVDFSSNANFDLGSGGAPSPVPSVSPFTVVKNHDIASAHLQGYALNIRELQEVEIRLFENCDECELPEHPYLLYKLEEVHVTRHNTSYFEGGSAVSEIVDLSFARYFVCAGTGLSDSCENGEFGWDLRTNQEP